MHRFKSAILAILKNCQNGTFEPVHEIQKFFILLKDLQELKFFLVLGSYESPEGLGR